MLELNKDNFEAEVLNSTGLVLVDFWSPKCDPCMELLPQVEELAKGYGSIKFCKLNIIQNRRVAIGQKVMGLPTIIFYRDGKKAASLVQDFDIDAVETKLKELMG